LVPSPVAPLSKIPPGREEALEVLLASAAPVRAGSKAAAWLKARRLFKKTWDGQGLRVVDNYRRVGEELHARFSTSELTAWGLFNKEGHLRFYRHTLLIPWLEAGRAVYLQARAPDAETVPPELFLAGPVPCPYNARLLDGELGRLYLCAGVWDTLAVLEGGFPAVGIPEVTGLKAPWLPRFRNKSVYVAFDGDADGEAAAVKVMALLTARGIEAHRLRVPAGRDVGDWLAGR
jgi:DNA primase